jgi:type IV pilus assembly protein PilM
LPQGIDLQRPESLQDIVGTALKTASFRGSDIALVIPDDAARIAFVNAETLPKNIDEQQTFLRWKLKKSVPFDVDTAQIAFRVLRAKKPAGFDIVVALSPRNIIEAYETLMERFDVQAGFVIPSTLAALALMAVPEQDTLFVKIAPDCVTTTVFQNKQMTFYRRVAELALYESVYPTVLYYQDKLGGTTFHQMVVCGNAAGDDAISELAGRIGMPAVSLEPRSVDDIYKPALGAVHLSWANLI